jgi:Flp pilus assembly pilin Flp
MPESYWRKLQAAPHWRGARLTGRHTIRTILDKLFALTQRDNGQTMAEYAVVLAVIAIAVFVALGVLSGAISGTLDTVTSEI